MCIGTIFHTISAKKDEILKTNTRLLEVIIISLAIGKIIHRQYDLRRRNELLEYKMYTIILKLKNLREDKE